MAKKKQNESIEHVIFTVKKELYAAPTYQVFQINKFTSDNISVLPGMPNYMIGMLLDEGAVLPLISLPILLGFEKEIYDSTMIVNVRNYSIGLCVKEVLGIKHININDLMPIPDVFDEWKQSFMKGAIEEERGLITVIDINNLLGENKIEEIKRISEDKV